MNTTSDNITATDVRPNTLANKPTNNDAPATPPQGDAAMHNIIVGGLWCVGGILVTALTYNAVKETGGHYVIAWGAIFFGGLQCLKGIGQLGG